MRHGIIVMKNNPERAAFLKWANVPDTSFVDDPLSVGYAQWLAWQARSELAEHDKASVVALCRELKHDNIMLRGKIVELRDEQVPVLKAGIETFISSADQYIQASEQHIALLPLFEALASLEEEHQ